MIRALLAVRRATDEAARRKAVNQLKNQFYHECRVWHGYLSAFAFIALIFFAATGLLLNHPDWLQGDKPAARESTLTLDAATLTRALAATDPATALAAAVSDATAVRGAYRSGEVIDTDAMLRFEGASGSTDVFIDLATGEAEISRQRATVVTVLHDLHKGKNTGGVWKRLIDVIAILILILSMVGYALFFALRLRKATSLRLTAISLMLFGGLYWAFVP
ncbi:PepSY-associated TM helix domain-containing protein [Parapedomonas caeni]